jgi:putative hemolysin
MVVASPEDALSVRSDPRKHVVDVLIEERAPRLAASPAWPAARPLLHALLGYGRARAMADAIAPMTGAQAFDHVSRLLSLTVEARGLERTPVTGRLVIISNHPTGIADGVAVYDAFKALRPDLCFFANADAFRVCPQIGDRIIPVEWVEAKRTRDRTRLTLQRAREAFEAERPVAIFPSGRLARRGRGGVLIEEPWAASALSLARKYDAPVLPIHLTGPDSTLFHLFDRVSGELRDITLFHELLNKRGKTFMLTAGPLIPAAALDPDAVAATAALKAYIDRDLPADPDRRFA